MVGRCVSRSLAAVGSRFRCGKIVGVVYKIHFIGSSRFYIGSAVDFDRRKGEHLRKLRSGKHSNKPLIHAFSKYGESALCFEVLEYVANPAELIPSEQKWLDSFSYSNDLYNTCKVAGSTLGIKKTPEERAKIAAYAKTRIGDKNPFFGKRHSDSAKESVSKANTGRTQSDETIRKRVASIKGNHGHHPKAKKVNQLHPKTGQVVATWDSIYDAAQGTKANISTISMICNKQPKFNSKTGKYYVPKTSGGYGWEFS